MEPENFSLSLSVEKAIQRRKADSWLEEL